MLEYIITSAITVVLTSIGVYVAGKKLINRGKDVLLDEIIDYLSTPEGQQNIYVVGTIFGKGIQNGLGLKGAFKPKGKIFGFPADLVLPFIKRFIPSLESDETPKSTKNEQVSGGKFDE